MKKFLYGAEYLDAVRAAISSAKHIDAAVAFWGAGSEHLFLNSSAPTRLVCNLLSGGTNPSPIQSLRNAGRVQIHHSSKLHSKVLLTDTVAIIGSANFSTNGLHYEGDELAGWLEAGIQTDDPEILSQVTSWFAEIWKSSLTIEEADLIAAAKNWKRSRSTRPSGPKAKSFDQLVKADLQGRPVYLVLWSDKATPAGHRAFERVKEEVAETPVQGIKNQELDFYEGWPLLPEDTYLIDAEISPGGTVKVGKLYRRLPELDPKDRSIQVVTQASKLQGLPFDYDVAFQASLELRLKHIHLSLMRGERNREMPLSDAIP